MLSFLFSYSAGDITQKSSHRHANFFHCKHSRAKQKFSFIFHFYCAQLINHQAALTVIIKSSVLSLMNYIEAVLHPVGHHYNLPW